MIDFSQCPETLHYLDWAPPCPNCSERAAREIGKGQPMPEPGGLWVWLCRGCEQPFTAPGPSAPSPADLREYYRVSYEDTKNDCDILDAEWRMDVLHHHLLKGPTQ